MTAKVRSDLISEIADSYSEYLKLTATAGSATTATASADLLEPDSYWIGHMLYVVTDAGGAHAAPEGQERPVTAYDQASATLTVSPAFSAAIGAGDICELLPLRRATIVKAINAAIQSSGMAWLAAIADEASIALVEGTYEYALPDDLERLARVLVRENTDEPWVDVPANNWRVAELPGAQVLIFNSWDNLSDAYTCRLEYYARPSEMATDAATLGLGEPAEREMVRFVVSFALYWLHDRASNISKGDSEFQQHYTKGDLFFKIAQAIKREALSGGVAKRVKTAKPWRGKG